MCAAENVAYNEKHAEKLIYFNFPHALIFPGMCTSPNNFYNRKLLGTFLMLSWFPDMNNIVLLQQIKEVQGCQFKNDVWNKRLQA